MISEVALNEFKELFRQEYGTELSDSEAADLAINLLTFMSAIHRPVKREWQNNK